MSKIHIFWDNSNIFVSARYVATRKEGHFAERDIRIHFDSLYKLAAFGRTVVTVKCVGSVPPDQQALWNSLKQALHDKLGNRLELYERGAGTGTEQAIDQALQVHMLRVLADYPPQVAILLTGDGAGFADGVGFKSDIERMKKNQWGIEVIAWDISCSSELKRYAEEKGVYIKLEDYYKQITFLEGTRRPIPLNLTHRPKATSLSVHVKLGDLTD